MSNKKYTVYVKGQRTDIELHETPPSSGGDMPLPMALVVIGIFLLIDYNLNFFICKFIWLLFKVGFYLMFGWWMGIDVF
jgi:hypothetical protein